MQGIETGQGLAIPEQPEINIYIKILLHEIKVT